MGGHSSRFLFLSRRGRLCLLVCLGLLNFKNSASGQATDQPSSGTSQSIRFAILEAKPLLVNSTAFAEPIAEESSTGGQQIGSPEMVQWLTQLIRDNLPPTYEDNRKWNKQKEVWNGVHMKLDGLKLETHRNRKLVNAGTWTRYEVSFVESNKNLQVQFDRLEAIDGARVAFETTIVAPLDIHGQLAEWARDVKLYSFSAHATAKVRMKLVGHVLFQLNMLKLPPDVAIVPTVDQAHIELLEYRLNRLSRVGGDAAELLGKGMRGTVENKLDDLNEKLVTKINTQIAKQQHKMSFSTHDWLMSKLPLPAAAANGTVERPTNQ